MSLTPTDWAAVGAFATGALVLWLQCRAPRQPWGNRRTYRGKRIGKPDEHSAGIMTSRRDVNTGSWS